VLAVAAAAVGVAADLRWFAAGGDMADQNQNMPNEASRKSKAEGERWAPDSENAGPGERSGYDTDEQGSGITNRPLDEEMDNQESLPERGRSQQGAHAGHGDRSDAGDGRSER
jgi:hypothetical protein